MERQPHPLNEEGLPEIPPEYFNYPGESDTHHLLYPRRLYSNAIERNFRDLLIVQIPRLGHVALHNDFEPPPKPSIDFMVGYVSASGIHIPRRLLKELKRENRG